jgi:hypothetical protein
MHTASRNRTQLHVAIALLSAAALLTWLVVHNSGGDSTSPPYKVTAAFMALHEQVICIIPVVYRGNSPHAVTTCFTNVFGNRDQECS